MKYKLLFNAGIVTLLVVMGVPLFAQTTTIVNGNFETGDLSGWTPSGSGLAFIVKEGTCFSFFNTTGLTLNGDFAANVRSGASSGIGILTSAPFVAGSGIRFRALSETNGPNDPVTLEIRVLDGLGTVLVSQIVKTNIVTFSGGPCPSGVPLDGVFSTHVIDTSALAGQTIRLQFRQGTNFTGLGFFTLIEDVETVTINGGAPRPLDHFKCYKAKIPKGELNFAEREVTLIDQFESKVTLVLKPKSVCTPVDKDGEGIFDPDSHFTCFKIKDKRKVIDEASGEEINQPKSRRHEVLVENLFGEQLLSLKKGETLCVPSAKTDLDIVE